MQGKLGFSRAPGVMLHTWPRMYMGMPLSPKTHKERTAEPFKEAILPLKTGLCKGASLSWSLDKDMAGSWGERVMSGTTTAISSP